MGRYVGAARSAFGRDAERTVRFHLGVQAKKCAAYGPKALPASAETLPAFIDAMAASRAPLHSRHRRRPPGLRMGQDGREPVDQRRCLTSLGQMESIL